MKKHLKFLLGFVLPVLAILGYIWGAGIITNEIALSLAFSSGLALLNFILFLLLYRFSIGKGNKTFLLAALGGIGVRLLLLLAAVFLVLFYLKVDRYGFIFGLLFWYVFLLIMEIVIVKDTFSNKKKQ